MTLFVVAIVLLVLIIRDQRKAIRALAELAPADAAGSGADHLEAAGPGEAGSAGTGQPVTEAAHTASVERGRIAALGGVVNLLWLVILVLMVWRP